MRIFPLATTASILALAATTAFAAPAKKESWATGQIGSVDTAARSVVVKQGTHAMTFALAPDATLTQGATTIQLSDLAGDAGKAVKIRYTMNGTTKLADRVQVAAAKMAAKKG
ncbi:MAG: hypothetical protein ABIT71_26475 [Vicinamibacteraceae bacterium]